MADKSNVKVTVSGIVPAITSKDAQYGNWFLIDQSGDFSLDRSVVATIWVVVSGYLCGCYRQFYETYRKELWRRVRGLNGKFVKITK